MKKYQLQAGLRWRSVSQIKTRMPGAVLARLWDIENVDSIRAIMRGDA